MFSTRIYNYRPMSIIPKLPYKTKYLMINRNVEKLNFFCIY